MGLVVAILSVGIYYSIRFMGDRAEVGATELSEIPEHQKLAKIQLASELSSVDVEKSLEVVKGYYEAKNWQERANFVRRAEQVRPLMEKYYQTHPDEPQICHGIEENSPMMGMKKTFIRDVGLFVMLVVRVGEEKHARFVALEEIPATPGLPSSYLVDWEVTARYQPMDIYDYRIKQPRESMDFRVLVSPGNYYNHGFTDKEQWQCYALTYPGDVDFSLMGYVRKGTILADELEKQLQAEANIILRVKYPEKAPEREQVEIEKIIHPTWFYPRPDATPGFR
jgi:hypothetical protein